MACAAPCWPAGWGPAVCGDRQGTVRGYQWHWRRRDLEAYWPACAPCLAATRAYQGAARAAERAIRERV